MQTAESSIRPPRAVEHHFGIGLRPTHYAALLENSDRAIDCLEIISENLMGIGGRSRRVVEFLRARYPFTCHGVGLSIGSMDPLDKNYLKALKDLIQWLEPRLVTDHLCWTSMGGKHSYDLLPFPLHQASLQHITERVTEVQEFLGRRILLENPSCYIDFKDSDRSEAEFLAELCQRTGCGVLLDLNNCIVNQRNLSWDPGLYLQTLKPEWVDQFHLAGHRKGPDLTIDTHDRRIPPEVWELFEQASSCFPQADVVIEWDEDIPPLELLLEELEKARHHASSAKLQPSTALSVPPVREVSPPMALRETQLRFFASLRDLGPIDPCVTFCEPNLPVKALHGLDYYRNAYGSRLLSVLQIHYPALHSMLQEQNFAVLMRSYIEQQAIDPVQIHEVGAGLSNFLRAHRLTAPFPIPQDLMADLAAFESYFFELHSIANETRRPLQISDLPAWTAEDWELATFQARQELRLLRSDWDIMPIWKAARAGESLSATAHKRQNYLFSRQLEDVSIETIDEYEATLWESLVRGTTLEQLIKQLETPEENIEVTMEKLMSCLHRAVHQQLLCLKP